MTLRLAIRPRIQLRDEPERSRAAWLPPMALPVATYWVVMGFASYGISKAPSWLASDETRPERSLVDTSPVQQFTRAVAARSELPPARSEPPVVREETREVRNETPTVRSTFDETPMPTKVPATIPHRPRLEPLLALPTAARAPRDAGRARDAHRSRRNNRPAGDSLDPALPSFFAMHGDPVPQDSFAMRDESAPTTFVPAPSDAAPAAARPVRHARSTLPSCESAVAKASNEWDLTAARGAPDLSRDTYAAVLENGAYLSHCAVPGGTALDICAAVQKGRAVGITVVAHPADPQVSGCVKAAVESLSFPSHQRLDVTRTHFEAVSGR
jgi:hypothetical protein